MNSKEKIEQKKRGRKKRGKLKCTEYTELINEEDSDM